VLLIGAGTGLDLDFIPPASQITATDLTPAMVAKIKKRSQSLRLKVEALVMDGHHLRFADETFDKIILHLILAVIPDPNQCLQEAERVLKPGGKVAVFDKFLKPNQEISPARKFLNYFTNAFFSDITRHFEAIVAGTNLKIESDISADFGGNFRIITLSKPVAEVSNIG
jgi:ubiquinone/menaquinone biosynthesis C-methylase UbiE